MTIRHLTNIVFTGLFYSCSPEIQEKNLNPIKQVQSIEDTSKIERTTPLSATNTQENRNEIILTMTSDSSYCYIEDVINHDNFTYLKVDFIQFLMDDKAIEEAKKHGEAAYDIEENGDTTFYVNNDYYIVNDNPKLRLFMLTDSTDIEFHELFGETVTDFKNSEEAMNRVRFSPFIIVTKDGTVTDLHEIFVP